MKKDNCVLLLIVVFLCFTGGCTNPTGAGTSTSPAGPTAMVTVTLETSAFDSEVAGDYFPATYEVGYLEYAAVGSSKTSFDSVNEDVFMIFNLSPVPSGANVAAATLEITISTFDASCPTAVTQITGAWDRTSVTVSTEPTISHTNAGSRDRTVVGINDFDITSLVKLWVSGRASNFGVLIAPTTATATFSNRTRILDLDSPASYPRIMISY